MSRAATPIVKAGLIVVVLVVSASRVHGVDLPSCTQEITQCLAACRAVASRRLADDTRDQHMARVRHSSADTVSLK